MMAHTSIEIDAVLAGTYRVERVLGRAGVDVVTQTIHLQFHQPVTMRFLLPVVLGSQQIAQRLLREACEAVPQKSAPMVHVIGADALETSAPYMVLEYLEGADLSSFPRSSLPVGGTIDLMLQASAALSRAHSLDIKHRDIRPGSFFITRGTDGTLLLKVRDFSVSKTPETDGQLTATQTVMGTLAYMSPRADALVAQHR